MIVFVDGRTGYEDHPAEQPIEDIAFAIYMAATCHVVSKSWKSWCDYHPLSRNQVRGEARVFLESILELGYVLTEPK